MVRRILNFISQEISGLHEAAYLLALFALFSQVLALVRDRLLAHVFGASHTLDIYYAAFRIPDLIFVSIASMVSISVLLPFLIEKIEKAGEGKGREFVDQVFSVFFLAIIVISAIVYFLVPSLIPLALPGFANDALKPELITLIRILLISPILLGFSNFLASITQMYNRFFLYAISPLLYNLGIIVGVLFLYPMLGIAGLAWGVVIGAFFHLFIQVPFIVSQKMFPRLTWQIDWLSIRRVIFISFPRTLALSSNQISTFFLISMASLMASGTISVLNFSMNLQGIPLGIIGVSYSSAAFPLLSRLFSSGDRAKFIEQVVASAKHIIFWSTPAMVLLVVLRAQVVRVVLGSGQFNWTDTRLTAAALAVFTLSVVPQCLVLLFIRAFYSGGRTIKPLFINVLSSSLIVVLGYVLVKLFYLWPLFRDFFESLLKIQDLQGSVVLMLALAYSIGVTVNLIVHWLVFQREFGSFSQPVLNTAFQSLSASVIMGFVAYRFLDVFDNVFNINTLLGIFLQGLCAGLIGIVFGVAVLKVLKSRELDDVWKTLHAKIWRRKVLVPEPEQL